MTDKVLFQQIRKLVREQKERTQLDTHRLDFAQEYCRLEMLKKKQIRHRDKAKINNIFKNFQNVESYINILDIIKNLSISLQDEEQAKETEKANDQLPEIIPKSLQMKMKEKLGPVLDQKYEEQNKKRESLIQTLKGGIEYGNSMNYESCGILNQIQNMVQTQRGRDKMEQIDLLRKDIKRKEVYFIQKKFGDQIKEISQVPTKIENTKIFHKVCSYLHMILEQEHKEKWASREDKKLREDRRLNSKKYIRIQGTTTPTLGQKQNIFNKSSHTRFMPLNRHIEEDLKTTDQGLVDSDSNDSLKKDGDSFHIQMRATFNEKVKRLRTTKDLLKQNFTFRKRNIKAGLMVKINQFVDTLTNEQKKNMELSKRYGKALQSLSQEIKTSYSRFEREEIAQDQDIEDMKKYLDNTLSRNKKDLRKFHHK